MFWDIPAPWPVWLSGAFSELKITANSTYWKAKLWLNGLVDMEREKGVIKLWKNPVDLPTAFYPVEYDLGIGCNFTPDPVLPDSDTIIILKPSHLVDIEITKNIF
jgi:hypothetical protein